MLLFPPNPGPLPDGELLARYPAACPCGHGFEVAPSFAMQWSVNTGSLTCSACGTFHHVEIAADGRTMTLEPWDAWRARWTDAEPPVFTVTGHGEDDVGFYVTVRGTIDPAVIGQRVMLDGHMALVVASKPPDVLYLGGPEEPA